MRILMTLAAATSLSTMAWAEPVTRTVSYEVDGVTLDSVLVYDGSSEISRPGLVMVPNWMGMNDGQIAKARAIAGRDYVVLVADVYGRDTRPTNASEAGAAAGAMYQDRDSLRARIQAAVDALKAQQDDVLDAGRIGAIGFCFGGSTVLELARAGSEIAGVVSFHGNLGTDQPAEQGQIKTSILVLNGAEDPLVPEQQIQDFVAEMRAAQADWQFVNYADAVHCFAESDANSPPNCLYHERTAKRAFGAMRAFFSERFGG